jgi:hypothetical protein
VASAKPGHIQIVYQSFLAIQTLRNNNQLRKTGASADFAGYLPYSLLLRNAPQNQGQWNLISNLNQMSCSFSMQTISNYRVYYTPQSTKNWEKDFSSKKILYFRKRTLILWGAAGRIAFLLFTKFAILQDVLILHAQWLCLKAFNQQKISKVFCWSINFNFVDLYSVGRRQKWRQFQSKF